MARVTASRLRRNLAIVIGNSGDTGALAALDRPGGGVANAAHSAGTPMVREHVDWARRTLSGQPNARLESASDPGRPIRTSDKA